MPQLVGEDNGINNAVNALTIVAELNCHTNNYVKYIIII